MARLSESLSKGGFNIAGLWLELLKWSCSCHVITSTRLANTSTGCEQAILAATAGFNNCSVSTVPGLSRQSWCASGSSVELRFKQVENHLSAMLRWCSWLRSLDFLKHCLRQQVPRHLCLIFCWIPSSLSLDVVLLWMFSKTPLHRYLSCSSSHSPGCAISFSAT